jgi:phospholipid/cholesterol/gamma-HCH transport system permease protein
MPDNLKIPDNPPLQRSEAPPEHSPMHVLRVFFEEVTLLTRFSFRFFKEVIKPPYEFSEVIKQSYLIGYKSFPLVAVTAFILGVVMTIQSRPTLEEFGAVSLLPSMVAVSIIRELGPAITAMIFAGKIGSSIGAELSSMKVTEQIDAMEVSGINPFKFLVVTRIIAAILMLPILVIAGDAISLYGAYAAINLKGTVSFQLFFIKVFHSLDFSDLFPAVIKTFFFGFAIGLIGCYKGYNSTNGTEGVGVAANSAVVFGLLSVFILDAIAVQITSLFVNL